MKTRNIFLALLAVLTLTVQTAVGQVNYRIEGNIGNPNFTGVMEVRDVIKQEPIDTIEVINGVITPKEGFLPEMALCSLNDTTKRFVKEDTQEYVESALSLHSLYIDNGTTIVEGLKDNWLQQSGTPISREIATVNQHMEEIRQAHGVEEGKENVAEYLYEVISKHSADVYGVNLLVNEGRWYMKPEQWLTLYDKLMSDNGEYIKATPYLSKDLRQTSERFKQLALMPKTDKGCMFADFSVEYDGKTTHLSDYVGRGNYVLADFWASWCGPCRMEIPNLIAAYEKYKDRRLQVLGIAAWDKPEATLKAIEEAQLPYPQIINTQKIATDLYGINAIPHIILFAPDGTILARGLRGEDLDKKLEEIFNYK